MVSIEHLLLGASVLLLLSIVASRLSDRLGVPTLLIFLLIGMLAGSDGPGGIHFNDHYLAQFLGVIALSLILFAGGLDTQWSSVRPVLWTAMALSTSGVFITALLVGWFATVVLGFSLLEGLLLGAVLSSTDAAAVFSVLRSKNVSLRGHLKPLLELESGSNDPMAVLLTVGFISLLRHPEYPVLKLIPLLVQQLATGALLGYLMGYGMVYLINSLKLEYEGLYPVLSLSLVILTYGATATAGGNGFLAVYIAGLFLGNNNFIHKNSLRRFHDGLAWLMQISMFLVLGLLVFPTHLFPVIGTGLLVSLFLMAVARPVAVFVNTVFSGLSVRDRTMVSWVGLRGAVPIVLATFPLLENVPNAEMIFNMVFFIVLSSALLQGTTIPLVARWLGVEAPVPAKTIYPIECESTGRVKCGMNELRVPDNSVVVNKRILDLSLPQGVLIALIRRDDDFIIPSGGTELRAGDGLLVLADREDFDRIRVLIETQSAKQREEAN